MKGAPAETWTHSWRFIMLVNHYTTRGACLEPIYGSNRSVWKLWLLNRNTWNYITVFILLVFDWNTWNNIHHHHHHVVLVARISLTLSRHFSLSFIASDRSSGLHPVSSHSCWMKLKLTQLNSTMYDLKKQHLYRSSSSSSWRAAHTDIPDPLSPLFPIVHRLRQVFWTTSRIFT